MAKTPKQKPDANPEIIGTELAFALTLSPQTRLVWDYLKDGRNLTQVIALTNIGVGSVTSRVSELRKALKAADSPWEVVDEWKKDFSGQRYKSYTARQKETK